MPEIPEAFTVSSHTFPVQVAAVTLRQATETSTFLASLEAVERVELRSETSGRVTNVYVENGQIVRAGQVLVELKSQSNTARLQAARANANAGKAAINTARVQVTVAESNVRVEEAKLELVQLNHDRYVSLGAEGALAQQRVDISFSDLRTAQERVQQAKTNVEGAKFSLEQAVLQYEQTLAQVALEEESVVTTKIMSSINGRLDNVGVGVGDVISTSTLLGTVVNNSKLDVDISVPAKRGRELEPGLKVELLDPQSGDTLVSGLLQSVSPMVLEQSQGVLASARFPNPDRALRDGQVVNARITWSARPTMLIPTSAVTYLAGQSFVFLYDEASGTAVQRAVKLGHVEDNHYKVLAGLEEGERFITTHVMKLRNESSVTLMDREEL